MEKKFRLLFFFSVLILVPLLAKPQLIKDEFTVTAFNDQFDEDKDNWRNMSNSDNLFLIQGGEYLLRRKNPVSGYSIFPKRKNSLPAFSLTASIKLEDSKNADAAVGLIFMAQEDASGAFIFEFNPNGQYRLKQLVGLNFKLLTGEVKTGGWVTSDALNPLGQYNIIEIRTAKRNYDVYVNEKYLLSFTEIAYKTGDIGIAIGAGTKARVDFITVKEGKPDEGKAGSVSSSSIPLSNLKPGNTGNKGPGESSGSANATSDVILKLIDQVSSLKIENQVLRDSLRLVKKQLRNANSIHDNTPQEQK